MPIKRRISRQVKIGGTVIGGDNPIAVQSMTNTDTSDVAATVAQINSLADNGCEIVRVAVPNLAAAAAVADIKKQIRIPLVADIHFDYRLALAAIESGADKLRINPGNIGSYENVKRIVAAAGEMSIPIRIGVNSGSLEHRFIDKYSGVTAEGLYESAMSYIQMLEDLNFRDIVISIKASNINMCLDSYELLARDTDYPLHIGITESGPASTGIIKSSVGIGALLSRGIGDTLRVSLTAAPLVEVDCAKHILQSLGLRRFGVEIISCPTCGRTNINVIDIAENIERRTKHIKKPIKIAVMGCAVNGPGEARDADIGVAGGKGMGVIFRKGQIIKSVPECKIIDELVLEIDRLIQSYQ